MTVPKLRDDFAETARDHPRVCRCCSPNPRTSPVLRRTKTTLEINKALPRPVMRKRELAVVVNDIGGINRLQRLER